MPTPQRVRGERRRHFSAERLSAAVRDLVHAGFAAGTPYDAIVAEVAAAGEKVSRGALSRYWRFWRAQQKAEEARLAARRLVKELKPQGDEDLTRAVEGLLASEIYAGLASAETKDLYLPDLLKGGAALVKANVSRRQLALDQDKLALARRKFEQALDRAGDKAKAAGKTLDPDILRMIREEVYGLPT